MVFATSTTTTAIAIIAVRTIKYSNVPWPRCIKRNTQCIYKNLPDNKQAVPRVEQRGRELWVLIPEDIAKALDIDEGDALSFEMLDKELAGIRKAHAIDEKELSVLKKLNEIKFAQRTKEKVRSVLADAEQKILGKLVKKGAVQFYEEGKYKGKGVYSISRDYYSFLSTKKPVSNIVNKVFGQQKYMITDSMERAKEVLGQLESEVKEGNVVSVRGFDKKIYITTRETMDTVGSKVVASLENNEMKLGEIASVCGEEEGLIRTVLEILRESGDVLEKRKEVYALV